MSIQLGHAPFLYEAASALGRAMYFLKLGRARRIKWRGQVVWCKRRHFYAPLIVICGNGLSRALKCGVYGLPHAQWLAWEETLSPLFGDGKTRRYGRKLLSFPMQGTPLRGLLPRENSGDAMQAALRELRRLHQTPVRFPDGTLALWSHGDAHAGNVFFDAKTSRAQWFDFESVHDLRASAAKRHADDLQTLLFSAAVYLPETQWPHMMKFAREIYDEAPVWQAILENLQRFYQWPNLVQLGHVHLTRRQHERLMNQISKGLAQK